MKDELPFSKIGEKEIVGLLDIFFNKPTREVSVKCNSPTAFAYFIKSKEVISRLRDDRTVNKIKALMSQQKEFFNNRINKLQQHFDTIQDIHTTWANEIQNEKLEYK